jgi:hypothetical protein
VAVSDRGLDGPKRNRQFAQVRPEALHLIKSVEDPHILTFSAKLFSAPLQCSWVIKTDAYPVNAKLERLGMSGRRVDGGS